MFVFTVILPVFPDDTVAAQPTLLVTDVMVMAVAPLLAKLPVLNVPLPGDPAVKFIEAVAPVVALGAPRL